MTTVAITTRAGKGSELTHSEMDANLTNIKAAVEGIEATFPNGLPLPVVASPATPAAGSSLLYSKLLNGLEVPAFMSANGVEQVLQHAIWRNRPRKWAPQGETTAVPLSDGCLFSNSSAVTTARYSDNTNKLTRLARVGLQTAASTAGTIFEVNDGTSRLYAGNGAGAGGFFHSIQFAVSDNGTVAGARMFCGLRPPFNNFANVEQNTVLNCIGIAQLSTDATQLYLVYGGSAAQTAIALGTGFPPTTGSSAWLGVPYDFTIYSPTETVGTYYWNLRRLDTGASTGGTLTAATAGVQTPATSLGLRTSLGRTNNATAMHVSLDLMYKYEVQL